MSLFLRYSLTEFLFISYWHVLRCVYRASIKEHTVLIKLDRKKIIIIWQGKSERSDWFFLGQDFSIWTVSMETFKGCVFFVFESRQIRNKHGPSAI